MFLHLGPHIFLYWKGGEGAHRSRGTDHILQWFVLFSWLQLLTGDEYPVLTTDELGGPEDEATESDEWVELQVCAETLPHAAGVHQDLEILTTLLAGPSSAAVAPDELQEQFPSSLISASASSPPTVQESNNDTKIIKGDTEDVFCGTSVPLSQQTPVTLEKSQFIPHVKPPAESENTLEVKMLKKEKQVDSTKLELSVAIAAPAIHCEGVNEENQVSQPLDPEPESAKVETQDVTRAPAIRPEHGPTLVETAEPSLGLDLLQDSEKISKYGDFSGTTASIECPQLLQKSIAAEATAAVHHDTEEGNSDTNQDACSSSSALHSIDEPTATQGTL